jgi:hypothetical protein
MLRKISPKRAASCLLRRGGWTLNRYVQHGPSRIVCAQPTNLSDVRLASLAYAKSLRLTSGRTFAGYLYCSSSRKPVLYATVAALLLKHLFNAVDEECTEELDYAANFQNADGLFRDPVIACSQAEQEDWWGWRHLTLLALMTFALYRRPAKRRISYIDAFLNEDVFRTYLDAQDWGDRVAWTSNAVQNIGVMMQYTRDYQATIKADKVLQFVYEYLDKKQDSASGLFGACFDSSEQVSQGVQAGYHFWLLYFYDKRPLAHIDRIIDSVLETQSLAGGFGVNWHSSACEDIDSIDTLVRLRRQTDYRAADIDIALQRSRTAVLGNLNTDGGWVFRRNESMSYGFAADMYSGVNQSNLFFTWFRLLGLALLIEGIGDEQEKQQLQTRWFWVPGLQFL